MPTYEIKTKAPKADNREIMLNYVLPDTTEELVALLGESAVHAAAVSSIKIDFQAAVRRQLEANKSDEEIVAVMATWKPGDKLSLPADPVARIKSAWSGLSPEQKAEMLAALQSQA